MLQATTIVGEPFLNAISASDTQVVCCNMDLFIVACLPLALIPWTVLRCGKRSKLQSPGPSSIIRLNQEAILIKVHLPLLRVIARGEGSIGLPEEAMAVRLVSSADGGPIRCGKAFVLHMRVSRWHRSHSMQELRGYHQRW